MKREHYRPFNPEQAKAGAPYGHISKDTKVKVYEYFDTYCVGAYQLVDCPWIGTSWDYSHDYLVMLPIATCQGKPAYPGDTMYDANGAEFKASIFHTQTMFDECTWEPARARVETNMGDEELDYEYRKFGLHGVANAAIQRAIDDGDVVASGDLYKIANGIGTLYGKAGGQVHFIEIDGKKFVPA